MRYNVNTIRAAGLECKWTKTRDGAPIIAARATDGAWYVIDARTWRDAEKVGIREAFENATALGSFFSISA